MKTLDSFIKVSNRKSQKITLEGLDDKTIDRFKSLEGNQINECCCDCGPCCCTNNCECGCNSSANQIVWYYSQQDISNFLMSHPKVDDLYNLHRQFSNKFAFRGQTPTNYIEPLYFKEICCNVNSNDIFMNRYINSEKLYNFIKSLCKSYGLGSPVVLDEINGNVKIFFNINKGSNGTDNSIKNSLIDVAEILDNLDEYDEIDHSQVLDVAIDVADDVYTFLIAIEICGCNFPNDIDTIEK